MTRSPMEVLSSLPVGMCSATEAIALWKATQRLVEAAKTAPNCGCKRCAELVAAVAAMEVAP